MIVSDREVGLDVQTACDHVFDDIKVDYNEMGLPVAGVFDAPSDNLIHSLVFGKHTTMLHNELWPSNESW